MSDDASNTSDRKVDPPPSGRNGNDSAPDHESPSQAWHAAVEQLAELREYAEHFAQTKVDRFKLAVRKAGILAVAGILGVLAACVFVVTAIVFLVSGIAHGLGELFGKRVWLGELVTGAVIVGGLAAVIWIGAWVLIRSSRAKTFKKYEQRKRNQQERYGHDVREQARQDGPH